MQSLYITKYVASELFLQYLKESAIPCDGILSDRNYDSDKFKQCTIANKPIEPSLLEYREGILSTLNNPFIILQQLPLSFIIPLLQKYKNKQITIINLYTWMGSFGRKLTPELDDISAVPANFEIYEPLDIINFHDMISKSGSKYLRIPHQHFPESIFSVEEMGVIDQQLLNSIEILSLKSYGYAGDNATLVVSGANFATAIQAGEFLQEQSTPIDIFIIAKLNAERNNELITSLKNTKKMIIMMDHQASKSLQSLITSQLKKHNLNDIEIIYFTPDYHQQTTIFDEFTMEQTGFDVESLVQKVI